MNDNNKPKRKKLTGETYTERAKNSHGDKYDYSEINFITMNDPVTVICHAHGEPVKFHPQAKDHTRTIKPSGCPACAKLTRGDRISKTKLGNPQEEFLRKAVEAHGDKYDYSKAVYNRTDENVIIICKKHGEFPATPNNHTKPTRPTGCPQCGTEVARLARLKSHDTFLQESRDRFGDTYDYGKAEYTGAHSPVIVTCRKHGDFVVKPYQHLAGGGCTACGEEAGLSGFRLTTERFIRDARSVHGDLYGYGKVIVEGSTKEVTIACPHHGDFLQKPVYHLTGNGCPRCGKVLSKTQVELRDFVKDLVGREVAMNHKLPNGTDIDVYIPDMQIGFEYNGIIWHSERFKKGPAYHLTKTELCEENGIRLIHIFEDDWLERKEVCKTWIKNTVMVAGVLEAKDWYGGPITDEVAKDFVRARSIKRLNLDVAKFYGTYHVVTHDLVSVAVMYDIGPGKGIFGGLATLEIVNSNVCLLGHVDYLITYMMRDLGVDNVRIVKDLCWEDRLDFPHCSGLQMKIPIPPAPMWTRHGVTRFTRDEVVRQLSERGIEIPQGEDLTSVGYYRIWDCGQQVIRTT